MALRFFDGWDSYTDVSSGQKWTGMVSSVNTQSGGRNGGNCLTLVQWGRGLFKLIDSQATWIVGLALSNIDNPPAAAWTLLTFLDGATVHVEVKITTSRTLQVFRNGVSLGTGTIVIPAGAPFSYIEVKVTISDTVGVIVTKINGVTDLNLSGLDTRNGGNASADTIYLSGRGTAGGSPALIDDFYACDASGAQNNDFLGDVRAAMCVPTGAGNYTQWTPSTGSNWQNVDETTHNSDTDYNSDSTPGHRDSFAMSNLPTGALTVFGVNYQLAARKDDAGTRQVAPSARISGTDYDGTTVSVTSGYVNYWELHELSPASGAMWTPTEVNAMEFGYAEVA